MLALSSSPVDPERTLVKRPASRPNAFSILIDKIRPGARGADRHVVDETPHRFRKLHAQSDVVLDGRARLPLRENAAVKNRVYGRVPSALGESLAMADDRQRYVQERHTLADAIVDTVRESLIVLDRNLRVVTASRSFYQTFGADPRDTQGRLLYDLGNGQWNISTLRRLLEEIIPQHRTIEAYEVEHEFPMIGRRTMLLNARQVFDEEHPDSTLLLAIEDITQQRDAEREKDELLRQKEMLLQEMQHRVANSLQIIASILLLKARTVQSEETRQHLRDAHRRVMSVATVQQQLQASGPGDRIEVGPYLSKLCHSLKESMLDNQGPHSLLVQAAAGMVESSQAVSLGLLTTELVINALKHAFPSGHAGQIVVRYDVDGARWRLSVSDNGAGWRDDRHERMGAGLGTSIVEALAHQLDARAETSTGLQGTTVSIIHAA